MTGIIIKKLESFIILMLLGVLSAKIHILKKNSLSEFSGLLVKIIFPCLGFSLIYSSNVSFVELAENYRFIIAELMLSATLLCLGILSSKLLRLPPNIKPIHIIQTTFGNQGFMNIPILMALYLNGATGVYIALFTFIDQLLLWTIGVIIISSSNSDQKFTLSLRMLKKVCNPMNVCMLLAFFCTSLHIALPTTILSTISSVGNTCFSLALIFLGANLSYIPLNNFFYKRSYVFLIIFKMTFFPVLVCVLCHNYLSNIETTVLTLMASMPAMSAIPMIADNYHADSEFASKTVLVMTICSILTIPSVLWMISTLGISLGS